jgi:hypothetical protein
MYQFGYFASANFFLFLVRRNSVDFASVCGRKSLAGCRFGYGGEAILSGYRLGGSAKPFPGEALFIWRAKEGLACYVSFSVFAEGAQNSPHIILSNFGLVLLVAASACRANGTAFSGRGNCLCQARPDLLEECLPAWGILAD